MQTNFYPKITKDNTAEVDVGGAGELQEFTTTNIGDWKWSRCQIWNGYFLDSCYNCNNDYGVDDEIYSHNHMMKQIASGGTPI
jgi:hypothetical protein